jgi:hypothetical protein
VTDVFILGAGFSRAVSERMPLLAELPALLQSRVWNGATWPARLYQLGDLEQLLTYLGQEQPWLSQAENLGNRAEFLRLSAQLSRIVAEQQNDAYTRGDGLEWFVQLVDRWDADRTPVISFNYDTLVEKVYFAQGGDSRGMRHPTQLYGGDMQSLDPQNDIGVDRSRESFRLLKLHGSLNWYYSGAPSYFGEPILYAPLGLSWSKLDDIDRWEKLGRGKVPLVVPPTADKSPFFANELVRSQWQQAAFELKFASRIFVLGYSLPETDLLTRFMLSSVSTGTPVHIVNKLPHAESLSDDEIRAQFLSRYRRVFHDVHMETDFVKVETEVVPEFARAYNAGTVR